MDIQNILAEIKNILPIIGLLIGGYMAILWVAALIWTYRDIRSRTNDVLLQVLSVSLVLILNFAGLVVYLILRPRETLVQKYERELEETYMRRDIEDEHVCPTCQRGIQPDFILCPYCQTSLRRPCNGCDRVIDLTWPVCPYCATPAGGGHRASQPIYRQTEEVLAR
ncbi:MAG TPA: zinc ribbon domain-containing protein [Herpetosiphonaceae bacterium]|nr:zinc ribbon domain-containing protein [Herpetosiphonaceae bacterium]